MKLILAILSNDDSPVASNALNKNGFSVTKLATTGGFLRAGNTTLIIGCEDEKWKQPLISSRNIQVSERKLYLVQLVMILAVMQVFLWKLLLVEPQFSC